MRPTFISWGRGRGTIERLLEEGELERVPPSDVLADRFTEEALAYLASARAIWESDPTGAYQLAYDAARKACTALLAVQGLRATTGGGHLAVQDAVREQFGAVFGAAETVSTPRSTPRPSPGLMSKRGSHRPRRWWRPPGGCSTQGSCLGSRGSRGRPPDPHRPRPVVGSDLGPHLGHNRRKSPRTNAKK